MYEEKYVDMGDFEVRVFKPRKICAMDRNDVSAIHSALEELAENEATRLYRLAWRMKAHGCSADSIEKCRDEARALHRVGGMNLWDILNPFVRWEYAFKC